MKISVGVRRGEKGQTIALVAVSLVAVIGFAALAIDITALYAARGQAQSAADAAALAGASIFATSSFSSVPASFPVSTEVCSSAGAGSPAAVNKLAEAAAHENSVSNLPATVTNITCNLVNGNPQVTVTVKRTNLPAFFSRIWTSAAPSVSATATAEAYNASGQNVPVQVTGAKPWLLPNCDAGVAGPTPHPIPCPGNQYVLTGSGTIVNNGSFIGKSPPPFTALRRVGRPRRFQNPAVGSFYTLDLGPSSGSCPDTSAPSCDNLHSSNYWDNIACFSNVQMSCGQSVGLGSTIPVISGGGTATVEGTSCLIHADDVGLGEGQDEFTPSGSGPPIEINGKFNNPATALRGVDNISRSDSIVTLPLYDPSPTPATVNPTTTSVPIVGFLQLGITQTGGGAFSAVVLNAVGCNTGAAGSAVAAGNTSPVTVRLIQTP